MNFKKIRKL